MKKATFLLAVTLWLSSSIAGPVQAQKRRNKEINAAGDLNSGEKVRGPAKVRITNLNILRYDIQIGQTVTFSAEVTTPKADRNLLTRIPSTSHN